jgi:hypothetical protein
VKRPRARQGFERETARRQKEAAHHQSASAAMLDNGDEAGATTTARLAEINDAIHGVEERAPRPKTGPSHGLAHPWTDQPHRNPQGGVSAT